MNKGKLVKIPIGPGRFVKMYEKDAIERGLIKGKPPAKNKMISPAGAENKQAETEAESAPPSDDFSIIEGIGPATVRKLAAQGITTFEALKVCDLSFLSASVSAKIEAWRSAFDG